MNHIIEVSLGVTFTALAFGAGILVTAGSWPPLPREKPEEFAKPPSEYTRPYVIRVEPLSEEKRDLNAVVQQLQAVQQRAARIEKLLDEKDAKRERPGL